MKAIVSAVAKLWHRQIEAAKMGRADWDKTVAKIMRYYRTPTTFSLDIASGDPHEMPFMAAGGPMYKVTIGKVGEFVRVMLPWIAAKAPNRLVASELPGLSNELATLVYPPGSEDIRQSQRDQLALGAALLNHAVGYTARQSVFNLPHENRMSCRDMLLSGRGVLWQEVISTPDGDLPAAFHVPSKDVWFDPTAELPRDAQFLVRRRRRPVWQIAEDFGPFGWDIEKLLKAATSPTAASEEAKCSTDTMEYFEVYSRMGTGHRLQTQDPDLETIATMLDEAGDHVFLAVSPDLDEPLNLTAAMLEGGDKTTVVNALRWPIELWADYGEPWPCSLLDPYPEGLYPKPPIEDSLPLISFIDFGWGWLMGHIKISARQILIIAKALGLNVKQGILEGYDLEVLEHDGNPGIDIPKLVHVLQIPEVKKEIFEILSGADRKLEESTGMLEILTGSRPQTQDRSATASQIRQANAMIRPQDLADQVEAFHSSVAAKNGAAMRLLVREQTIAPILGETMLAADGSEVPLHPPLTAAWMQLLATDHPYVACSDYSYSIEAGSGRRKNRDKLKGDMQEAATVMLPAFMDEYHTSGDPGPINAWLYDWATSLELDPGKYQFPDRRAEMAAAQTAAMEQAIPGKEAASEEPPVSEKELVA